MVTLSSRRYPAPHRDSSSRSMLAASGARPLIDSMRPLAEGREAFARLLSGEEYGKLVLEP